MKTKEVLFYNDIFYFGVRYKDKFITNFDEQQAGIYTYPNIVEYSFVSLIYNIGKFIRDFVDDNMILQEYVGKGVQNILDELQTQDKKNKFLAMLEMMEIFDVRDQNIQYELMSYILDASAVFNEKFPYGTSMDQILRMLELSEIPQFFDVSDYVTRAMDIYNRYITRQQTDNTNRSFRKPVDITEMQNIK